MAVHRLGGKNGDLRCGRCGKPRWPGQDLCPDCWGQGHDRGTRNTRGVVIQEKLPKELWQAAEFAASMIRNGTPFHRAVVIAAKYYKVEASEVQRALAQRSGRNRRGRRTK